MQPIFSTNDLLLNILIVLTPTFVYQISWAKTSGHFTWRDKLIVGLCSTFSLIMCMSYPITFNANYVFDLRFLPVLLSFLYGGRWAGVGVTLLLLAYRYSMGGTGFYYTLVVNSALSAVLFAVTGPYQRFRRRRRLMFAVIFAMVSSVLFSGIMVHVRYGAGQPFDVEFMTFLAVYVTVHGGTAWLTIFLIEDLQKNMRLRENIQRSEKLHVLSELSASVAHEIRNPLTTARGFMQLLRQMPKLEEKKRQHYIGIAMDELDRAQTIINDFLAFAKPQAERLEVLELSPQLRQAVEIVTPYATMANVEIGLDGAAVPEARLKVNKEKFIQCLVNILKNSVESIRTEAGRIHISVDVEQGRARICIVDNGIGMTDEQVKRMGEPFYSTKEKGTGLGMMLCFRIIESFQGRIDVASQRGVGTRVTISLPVESAELGT